MLFVLVFCNLNHLSCSLSTAKIPAVVSVIAVVRPFEQLFAAVMVAALIAVLAIDHELKFL